MTFTDRALAVKGKLRFYGDEVSALKNGSIRYAILFAPILVLLFPVLAIEVVVLLVFGLDAEINQTREPEIPCELREEEVPPELRRLIPYAKKWGIGDAEELGKLLETASLSELKDIKREVGPRMQQIVDWTDTYSENDLKNSAIAGCFIYLQVAYEEVSTCLEQPDA